MNSQTMGGMMRTISRQILSGMYKALRPEAIKIPSTKPRASETAIEMSAICSVTPSPPRSLIKFSPLKSSIASLSYMQGAFQAA